ncbi:hypothetical protein M422DRAFT_259759 [Sphaerobolus stellatus SS14]|uniref:Uncharacterized protein n=1 Tax=Sphaerobolus stellatus (strain SS14) TaxID=990650 RepID=A0A0C9VJQ2_SPHS4|nr:hypothetical protein M422DRAFT_259759 [Sphaerobolus stellatus SS14]
MVDSDAYSSPKLTVNSLPNQSLTEGLVLGRPLDPTFVPLAATAQRNATSSTEETQLTPVMPPSNTHVISAPRAASAQPGPSFTNVVPWPTHAPSHPSEFNAQVSQHIAAHSSQPLPPRAPSVSPYEGLPSLGSDPASMNTKRLPTSYQASALTVKALAGAVQPVLGRPQSRNQVHRAQHGMSHVTTSYTVGQPQSHMVMQQHPHVSSGGWPPQHQVPPNRGEWRDGRVSRAASPAWSNASGANAGTHLPAVDLSALRLDPTQEAAVQALLRGKHRAPTPQPQTSQAYGYDTHSGYATYAGLGEGSGGMGGIVGRGVGVDVISTNGMGNFGAVGTYQEYGTEHYGSDRLVGIPEEEFTYHRP